MTATTATPENEFADLPTAVTVQRRWFTASVGGHVSAVVWGAGTPEVVVVPDTGVTARDLDGLGEALQPVVLIDRLGTGRSSGPAPSTPAREARPLAEAVWSFANRATTLVGLGEGGAAAALAAAARTRTVTHVVLVGAAAPESPNPALDEKGITVTAHPDVDAASPSAVAALLDPTEEIA
ncbi:hypothetical protein [Jatrophihabitans fulvus]